MSGQALAAFGAVVGALVATLGSVSVSLSQRRSALRHEHRLRAFEQHLDHYQKIFVTARSTQEALRDYAAVERRIADRADIFLQQLLSLVAHWAREYCLAVDWHHNAGIMYFDAKLEQRCFRVRDLLTTWMSQQRLTIGNAAFIKVDGTMSPIPLDEVLTLQPGDYAELRIEKRTLAIPAPHDEQLIKEIDRAVSVLVTELRAIIAY